MPRELRFLSGELRAGQDDSGKRYLSGYAAKFGVQSQEIYGFREKIAPGAFTRALKEKQDVRYLINHDTNLVLGRTKSGTLELSEDDKGLKFRCELPNTSYANDLAESVSRGDINECSFAFIAKRQQWTENDSDLDERELQDVDLFDVSTVTYPAYPNTVTELNSRAIFPDGVPAEVRSHLRSESKTKRVDGEDLTADCFLIVGDADDTSTWHLPWKFSTEEKTKSHLRDALARFDQVKGVSEADLAKAKSKLLKLCKEHDIDVSEEDSWKPIAAMRARLHEVS